MAPSDEVELMHAVATAAAYDDGPSRSGIREGRGSAWDRPARGEVLPIGQGRIVREGKDVAILSVGTRLQASLQAAEHLQSRGLSCTVADAPLRQTVRPATWCAGWCGPSHAGDGGGGSIGGFGSFVLDYLVNEESRSAWVHGADAKAAGRVPGS